MFNLYCNTLVQSNLKMYFPKYDHKAEIHTYLIKCNI